MSVRSPSLLLICAIASCASAPTPTPSPRAAAPEQQEVRGRARAVLDAYDASDESGLLRGIGETFTLFEAKHVHPRAELLETMRARRARGAPYVQRSYEEEEIRVSPEAAVYLARTREHMAAEPGRPARDFEGWNTLVFARDARGTLVAVHWDFQPAGSAGTCEVWNAMLSDPRAATDAPNGALVEAVRGVKPGSALDLGTGRGRNALFLAERGWQVTGVDIADVGLDVARTEAAKRKLDVALVQADLDGWDMGRGRWDLVTMIYMGSDAAMVRRAQASLKPGGLFVLSGFAPETDAAGPDSAAGGSVAAYFGDDFTILRNEVSEGIADWGLRRTRLIHFVARRK